jgi:two-component system chemotaxis response regulator CheB
VVIVASAGGLSLIERLLTSLPRDLGAAIVILMHLTPRQPSLIAELFSSASRRRVTEARTGDDACTGSSFVAPPDHHLLIERDGTLRLTQEPPVHFARPSADVLLSSAARSGRPVIAVVLSGAGVDGAQGAVEVRRAGGHVLVQDPLEAQFPSMPQAAVAAGAAERILPLERMGQEIERLLAEGVQHAAS